MVYCCLFLFLLLFLLLFFWGGGLQKPHKVSDMRSYLATKQYNSFWWYNFFCIIWDQLLWQNVFPFILSIKRSFISFTDYTGDLRSIGFFFFGFFYKTPFIPCHPSHMICTILPKVITHQSKSLNSDVPITSVATGI